MAGIAKRVQLFNEAYRTGWELLAVEDKHDTADTAARLKENIYVLMNAGWDNPHEIAQVTAERMRRRRLRKSPA